VVPLPPRADGRLRRGGAASAPLLLFPFAAISCSPPSPRHWRMGCAVPRRGRCRNGDPGRRGARLAVAAHRATAARPVHRVSHGVDTRPGLRRALSSTSRRYAGGWRRRRARRTIGRAQRRADDAPRVRAAPQPVLVAESEPPSWRARHGFRRSTASGPSPPSPGGRAHELHRRPHPSEPAVGRYTGRLESASPSSSSSRGSSSTAPSWSPTSRPHRSRDRRLLAAAHPAHRARLLAGAVHRDARAARRPGLGARWLDGEPLHFGFAQIYSPDHVTKGISAAWSLNVEMTFYLFVPLYAASSDGEGRAGPWGRSCASSSTAFLPW